jgi:hypothetical protein
MARRQQIIFFSAGLIASLLLGGLGLGPVPVIVKQGIDFHVTAHPLPLYLKALDFVDRDLHYTQLAQEITRGLRTDRERVMAVLTWTRRHIRRTPAQWPIFDDHILHIIIRGHGLDDQMADVFTTLSTYAGVPAFWQFLSDPPLKKRLILSFAKVGGTWAIIDVWNGGALTNAQGQWLTVEEVVANPQAVVLSGGDPPPVDVSYARYLVHVQGRQFVVPKPLRAELQQPWPRLVYETRRAISRLASAR